MQGMVGPLSAAMIVYGVLQCLLWVGVILVGIVDGGDLGATIFAVVWGLGVMAHGLLWIVAGARIGSLRSRTFGLGVLLTAPLAICSCYCSPFALGIMVFGLLVLMDGEVKKQFEEAEQLY